MEHNWTTISNHVPRQPVPGLAFEVELSTDDYNELMAHLTHLDDFHLYCNSMVREQAEINAGRTEDAVLAAQMRRKYGAHLRTALTDWIDARPKDEPEAVAGILEVEVKP